MKKITLSLFITLATLFSLCGCSNVLIELDRAIGELDSPIASDSISNETQETTLSSDEESNISTLANIYKSTKFIVGYWNGSEIRYLTN